MANGRRPPVTLAQLRDMIAELREDRAAESEAIAALLHGQDRAARCLGVIATQVKHLHDDMARRKVRRRGVHRNT